MLAAPPVVRAAGALALLLFASAAFAQVSLGIIDERLDEAEDRIQAALQQKVSWSFAEVPLKEMVEKIKERTSISIVLATKKLEEAAISVDTPLTVSLPNVTLDSFLRSSLGDLGLTYLIKGDILQITTPEDAGSQLEIRLYPVLDLVARRTLVFEVGAVVTSRTAGGRASAVDYESLKQAIVTTIDPDTWEDVGGPGSTSEFDNAGILIIAQTQEVHQKIAAFLTSLRKVKGLQGLSTASPPKVSSPLKATHRSARRADAVNDADRPFRQRVIAPQRSWQLPQVYEE